MTVSATRGRQARWTREEVVEKIRAWHALHGDPPRASDWNPSAARWAGQSWRIARYRDGEWPSLNVVKKLFGGSLTAAIVAAGFEPAKPGPKRRSASPQIDRPDVPSDVLRRLEGARVDVNEAEAVVVTLRARLDRADACIAELREKLRDRPVRTVTRPSTRTITKTVTKAVDDPKAARLERALRDAEALEVTLRAAVKEAQTTATRMAAKLERAEAKVTEVRADRNGTRQALRKATDRATALAAELAAERDRAPVVVERVVEHEVEVEVESVDAAELAAARQRAHAAELRAAKAEREHREAVALMTGEQRRLTPAEVADLNRTGPGGPTVLAKAIGELARVRKYGTAVELRNALTGLAAAAITWRERIR